MTTENNLLSCCPNRLYGAGGFFDPFYDIAKLYETYSKHEGLIAFVAEIFPSSLPARSAVTCPSGDGFAANDASLRLKSASFTYCSPSILVRIARALIWNNMLFAVDGQTILPIYETYRWPDRGEQGENLAGRLPAERVPLDAETALFVGSSGSFNYGHWLADDFARMSAMARPELSTCSIIMSSFNEPSDNVRREGASLFMGSSSGGIQVLDRAMCYEVNDLYYATPISYHPSLKNGHALAFTRSFLLEAAGPVGTSDDVVFINRALGWPRQITNLDEVRALCATIGARELLCESLPLLEQVRAVKGAKKTFGIMGAAMTNQIFQPVDAPCLHISPSGWDDPFYWDLSSQLGRDYYVEFGPADEASHDRHFLRSFHFDVTKLEAFLAL